MIFENVGKKIKAFTEWYAKLTIALIWIAATIILFDLIAENDAEYALIPIACAIVITLLVMLGSMVLYAFGDLVDDVSCLRKTFCTDNTKNNETVEKISVDKSSQTKIVEEIKAPYCCGNCGFNGPYDGNCPSCGSSIKKYNISYK